MGEKDDSLGLGLGLGLGLSLSLGLKQNSEASLNLGLLLSSSSSSSQLMQHNQKQKQSWNDLFQSSDRSSETRTYLRGIDVNQAPPHTTPAAADCEDDVVVSSPNSTISSISGKRSEREPNNNVEENEAERASCSLGSDDEDGGGDGGDGSGRKKLRLSKEQAAVLEDTFKEHSTLNPKQKLALAKQLNLRSRQVEVWFQNRRARTKLKQTEVDCEYLKRCCDNLTEENRRLQKEVQELRALKLSPQFYMQMNPPTTLTMCPSCERVAVSSSSSSSATATAAAAAASLLARSTASNDRIQRPIPINPWAAKLMQAPRS